MSMVWLARINTSNVLRGVRLCVYVELIEGMGLSCKEFNVVWETLSVSDVQRRQPAESGRCVMVS
jgi:hypothetical protein